MATRRQRRENAKQLGTVRMGSERFGTPRILKGGSRGHPRLPEVRPGCSRGYPRLSEWDSFRFSLPGRAQGGFLAQIRPKPHFTEVFAKNVRPSGPFFVSQKSGFRLVYTGSGTDLRRCKMKLEKMLKMQKKRVHLTDSEKITILDHCLILPDTTTQFVSIFNRKIIDFYRLCRNNLEMEICKHNQANQSKHNIYIYKCKIIEFLTLTRVFDFTRFL